MDAADGLEEMTVTILVGGDVMVVCDANDVTQHDVCLSDPEKKERVCVAL